MKTFGNLSPPGDGMVYKNYSVDTSVEEKFVLSNGLVLSVLDSQSLGARFNAWMEVYPSILFLPHLCQQSNSYHM